MEQLIADLLAALKAAGLRAMRGAPGARARTPDEPVVCVSVKEARCSAAGFYDYLGVIDDTAHGLCDLYGRRMECALLLTAVCPRASGAQGAEEAAIAAADAICAGELGRRVSGYSLGQARYDGALDAFCCPLTATVTLLRYAATDRDGQTITDFELRGEWK